MKQPGVDFPDESDPGAPPAPCVCAWRGMAFLDLGAVPEKSDCTRATCPCFHHARPGPTLDRAAEAYLGWARATFPGEDLPAIAAHLAEEARELKASPLDPEEMADVFLMVVWLAHNAGVNLAAAALAKLEVNRGRQWQRGPDGLVRHVERT